MHNCMLHGWIETIHQIYNGVALKSMLHFYPVDDFYPMDNFSGTSTKDM